MGMPQQRGSDGRFVSGPQFGRRAGDDTFFEITNKDIYDEVRAIGDRVGRVESRVGGIESRMAAFHRRLALAVPTATVLASVATVYYSFK